MEFWERRRVLAAWMAASLFLHVVFLAVLGHRGSRQSLVATIPIEVDLASQPSEQTREVSQPPPPQSAAEADVALLSRQIVHPPDAGEEAPPRSETRLLSDRDNRVDEEFVRRGGKPVKEKGRSSTGRVGENRASVHAQRAPSERRAVSSRRTGVGSGDAREQGTRVAAVPKIEELLPKTGDVPLRVSEGDREPAGSERSGDLPTRRLLMNAGRSLHLHPGTTDFLPGIREGDIALLNTKAERFAPFVRRVAARIFQHLEIRLRQAAHAGSGSPGREFAVVEAVMDRQGRFVRAQIVRRESTSTFGADRVLLGVTNPQTFFDANPPPGAEAEDGNIHFVLLIDLEIVAVPDPHTGRMAIGYSGIAGVGLDALPDRRAN